MLSQPARLFEQPASPATIALAGLAALAVAMGIGRFAFTPMLPMMHDDAGVSVAQGGYLAAANYIGYLVGALCATRPARSLVAMRGALLAIAAATLGMGVARGFFSWMALRALAGIASAWALVYVSSWCLGQLAPLRRPVLTGAVFSGVGCGIVLAGGVCLALASLRASSSQTWIALGMVCVVITAAIWPFLGANGGEPMSRASVERYRWTADALRLVFCYGVFGFGYIIPATFVPLIAKQAIEDPALFGWAWPIFGLTAAASTLAAAPLARVLGNRRLWILGVLAMALGVASPLFLPAGLGVLVAAILVGGTFMVVTMAGMQEARRVAGDHAPVLMAAMTSSFAAGQIAGPLCVSYIVQGQGNFAVPLALASLLLVLSAIALAIQEKK